MFASVVRMGKFLWMRVIDSCSAYNRAPLPRSDLRFQKIPLGPVAVLVRAIFHWRFLFALVANTAFCMALAVL